MTEMRKTRLFNLVLLLVCVLFVQDSQAQNYTRWGLPEGAIARFGRSSISEMAYSPDGTQLAVASGIGIWIYNAPLGAEVALLTGHRGSVLTVSFSPDGTMLASGGKDGTIRLWDMGNWQSHATLEWHGGSVHAVAFSPDGTTLASGHGDGTVRLWDVNTGHLLAAPEGHRLRISSVAFSPDGKTLASGSHDGTVRLWAGATGKLLTTIESHSNWVTSVAFSSDGKLLASSGGDYRDNSLWGDFHIRVWEVNTGQIVWDTHQIAWAYPRHTRSISSVAFWPNSHIVASASDDGTIRLWEGGNQQAILEKHWRRILSVAFSPDGQTLASKGLSERIWLWDVNSGQQKAVLAGYTGRNNWVSSLAFSPDGQTLASGNVSTRIVLWDVETGQPADTLAGHDGEISSVAFSPDGHTLASGSWDGSARLWDVETSQQKAILKYRRGADRAGYVQAVAFSSDGKTLASGSRGSMIRLWDVGSGELLATCTGRMGWVESVAFSPDGRTLASGSQDATVRLWDVETGQQKTILEGHTASVEAVAFSPDGFTLASGSQAGEVRLWDVDTSQQKAILTGYREGYVHSLAYSPDGHILASGSLDGTILLWDMSPYIRPQSATEVEVTILGTAVENLTVEFARTSADRRPHYAYSATTDAAGQVALTITSADPDGISGLYQVRIRNEAGEVVGQWNSIPLNEDRRQTLELTLDDDVPVDALKETTLAPNVPNPFNCTTQLAYYLTTPGPVRLDIYNVLGQRVHTLVAEFQSPGAYQLDWSGHDQGGVAVGAGVYLTRFSYPGGVQTRRLLYLK
ncbi:MAG: T9SS type A sorting domain-containing protein [Holophagales bacterium]|nr:T9SS type A sorting domain-containing protein [Holophagales bacterium]